MAWTAPRTYVTAEVITASILNTDIRDNLLQTAPGKAANAGEILVVTGANAIAARLPDSDVVATSETTASTSYSDLSTTGPTVTLTTGTRALMWWRMRQANSGVGASCYSSVDVSGASTISASDQRAFAYESGGANDSLQAASMDFLTAHSAGSNVFELKYRVTSGTGTFQYRELAVMPL